MTVIGLDPGTSQSAIAVLTDGRVGHSNTLSNEALLESILDRSIYSNGDVTLVLERVESMGMAVGREVFTTVFWSGRFAQAWPGPWDTVSRRDVKLHLCGTMRAKDANIRAAIIDHFGPGKEKAVGTRKSPGPLHGVKGHEYAALAVALTWLDKQTGDVSREWASR